MKKLALLLALASVPATARAQEVWRGDFETNDTSQWNGELNGTVGGSDQITVVDDVVIEGSHAARIELVNEAAWSNGLKRVELHHSPAEGRTEEGDELYFAWSLYLPETLPTDPSQQIAYWETDGSYSQLMAFTLIGTDLRFSTNHPDWTAHWTGSGVVTPATWHRIAMHIVWSTDPSVGTVDVWFDGEPVVTAAHAATLVDANSAFTQLGLLRGRIEFTDAPVIYLDDVVEGDSLASVRPTALEPAPDAAVSLDAGGPFDAGALVDAGPGFDAGPSRDAGTAPSTGGCSVTHRGSASAWISLALLGLLIRPRFIQRTRGRAAAPR